jgi:hypothetical protein
LARTDVSALLGQWPHHTACSAQTTLGHRGGLQRWCFAARSAAAAAEAGGALTHRTIARTIRSTMIAIQMVRHEAASAAQALLYQLEYELSKDDVHRNSLCCRNAQLTPF